MFCLLLVLMLCIIVRASVFSTSVISEISGVVSALLQLILNASRIKAEKVSSGVFIFLKVIFFLFKII